MKRGSGAALLAFMVKEVRHILRDRQTLLILLLLPLAMVVIFGFALRSEVRTVRVVFVDPAADFATAELKSRFAGNGRFEVVGSVARIEAAQPLFRRDAADILVAFEPGFAQAIGDGSQARILVLGDASDPNTGSMMQTYTNAVIAAYQAELQGSARGVTIDVSTRMRYNPLLRSVNLFVPGLIALVLTLVTALMTAISLSREKERGTLEVLLVSPLHPWQIIVGKVLPYLGLAFANVVTALLAAWAVFDVPFVGSLTLLLAASTLYSLVGLALGVLIAAVTDSQRAAMLGALLGTMMPNTLLSGMIFPLASLPGWMQAISLVVPQRWFIIVARGIMLKGAGLEQLWQPLAILSVMLVVLMALGIRKFKPRLA